MAQRGHNMYLESQSEFTFNGDGHESIVIDAAAVAAVVVAAAAAVVVFEWLQLSHWKVAFLAVPAHAGQC